MFIRGTEPIFGHHIDHEERCIWNTAQEFSELVDRKHNADFHSADGGHAAKKRRSTPSGN